MRKTFSLPVAATAAGGGVTPPPADTVDNIEHSVRFNSADSAYLSRTPSSAGNRKTWTWSGWVKRSELGRVQNILRVFNSSDTTIFQMRFMGNDAIGVVHYSYFSLISTPVYRDVSAWYHVVVVLDTTQATASNRLRFYINGTEITTWATDNRGSLTQDSDQGINQASVSHEIGGQGSNEYFNGYLANIHFVDGQALTPSSFGFTDSNGVWQPKAYTGSYGTNGYNLDFADTSSATALGNDVSGNNNDWTPSGLVAGPAYTANSFSTEFDGTGDYLNVAETGSEFTFGTGDFTIEFWVYRNNTNQTVYFDWRNTGGAQGSRPTIYSYDSQLRYFVAGTDVIIGTDLSANTWHHVALCRSGTSTKMFVNGTQVGSTYSDNNTYLSPQGSEGIYIGAFAGGSLDLNGYISNVRIIKGRALYTAAFTPPSTALTATDDTVLLTCQDSTFIDNSASAHTITANGNAATTTVSPFEPVDGSDAMLDSPTNYGSGDLVRGNYCTVNPLDKASNITLSNGNLDFSSSGNTWHIARSTFAMSSGKWYWEVTMTGATNLLLGISTSAADFDTYLGGNANGWGYNAVGGDKYHNASFSTYGASYAVNDVIGIAFDADSGTLVFYKNGVSQGTAYTGLTSGPYFPTVSTYASSGTVNFGQQPFKYPLAGYKSLCSTNLPTPAIADGSTAMDVKLYTGNSSTQTISGLDFSPDLVWIKERSGTRFHALCDSVRGDGLLLYSNSTLGEQDIGSTVVDLTSDGFNLGFNSAYTAVSHNHTGQTHAAWTWDAGSSTVSNTDGSITSQVRANPTAGFSIVTYTGNELTNQSVGHGLNVAPKLYIQKRRDSTSNWGVTTNAAGPLQFLTLNTTDSATTASPPDPTSTVVYVSGAGTGFNINNASYITYCFAPVEGFSSFGTFTGSTSNTFVYTGMRPRWLMIKRTDTTGDWQILDTKREGYNVDNDPLWANLTNQEGITDIADILSNGFKMRDGATGDYIYAAFAEHPFKTSRAR